MSQNETKYVAFTFYSLKETPTTEPEKYAWAQMSFLKTLESIRDIGIKTRTYLCRGITNYADLLLWYIADSLDAIQDAGLRFSRSRFAQILNQKFLFLGMKQKSPYFERERPQAFEVMQKPAKYLFVYPFVKTSEWFQLPFEKRQELMKEHRDVAVKFDKVYSNTLVSFGLGDYEWLLAFECDDPADFSNLLQALREAKARIYTKLDTPIIPARFVEESELLTALGF
mgnify:CR=1 FL=1